MNLKAATLLRYLGQFKGGTVVEVGTVRFADEIPSDGYSTIYLGQYCYHHGWDFRSFDCSALCVDLTNRLLAERGLPRYAEFADGASAIAAISDIGFLYLDGSDDPEDSLRQFRAARLRPGAIVIVDDCQSYGGNAYGKGNYLRDHLQTIGVSFSLIDTEPGYCMLVAVIPEEN